MCRWKNGLEEMQMYKLGIDVGGTTTDAVLIDVYKRQDFKAEGRGG